MLISTFIHGLCPAIGSHATGEASGNPKYDGMSMKVGHASWVAQTCANVASMKTVSQQALFWRHNHVHTTN